MIKVTSENGIEVLDEVYFEREVVDEFLRYIERSYGVKITVVGA